MLYVTKLSIAILRVHVQVEKRWELLCKMITSNTVQFYMYILY